MTKRLIALVLAVATAGGAQGSLLYAATLSVPGPPPGAAVEAGGGATGGHLALLASASSVLPDAADAAGIGCLRGGTACFGIGSWDCCGEFFVLMAIGSAAGAWLGAAAAAWAYWYYCLHYEQ